MQLSFWKLHSVASVLLIHGIAAPAASGEVEKASSGQVQILRTPDSGIQPQAVIDAEGTLHLIYFTSEPAKGNLFCVRREANQDRLSAPVRVNNKSAGERDCHRQHPGRADSGGKWEPYPRGLERGAGCEAREHWWWIADALRAIRS